MNGRIVVNHNNNNVVVGGLIDRSRIMEALIFNIEQAEKNWMRMIQVLYCWIVELFWKTWLQQKDFKIRSLTHFFSFAFKSLQNTILMMDDEREKKTNKQTITRPRNLCLLYDTQESKTKNDVKLKNFQKKR